MVAQGKAKPRQKDTKKGLALQAAIEADEAAKAAQRQKDASASQATAEKALKEKHARNEARRKAEAMAGIRGRKVR